MATLDKNDNWFQQNYATQLSDLSKLDLNASIQSDGHQSSIVMSWKGVPFILQFSKSVWCDEANESTLAKLADAFFATLPELYPALKERKNYLDVSGKDLPIHSLVSIHDHWDGMGDKGHPVEFDGDSMVEDSANAYGEHWDMVVEELDFIVPFNTREISIMREMYLGAAISQSQESFVKTFLTRESVLVQVLAAGLHIYRLKGTMWLLGTNVAGNDIGVAMMYNGPIAGSDVKVATWSQDKFRLLFKWFGNNKPGVPMTWAKLQTTFGISKSVFMSRLRNMGDPLATLKACYTEAQSAGPVAKPAPTGFNLGDFFGLRSGKVGDYPAYSYSVRV
jgi:hypothetical protein